MKKHTIALLIFWLITANCDKPVSTDFQDPYTQQVAVSITASAQVSSVYKITISGPAMETIGPKEYAGGQTIQLYVPEGTSRKFHFERFNSSRQLTDTGTTVSDIGTGMNIVQVTLVSATKPDSCSVNYIGNGNTAGKVPDVQRQVKGGILKLDTNSGALVKADYAFRGWNTEPDGKGKDYQPGSNYTADSNLTLYAKWVKLLTYTISYNGNGNDSGEVPAGQVKTEGVDITLAFNTDTLTKIGYTFVGWNSRADGNGQDYSEGASYTSDSSVILYARWTQLETYKITYRGNDSTGGSVPAAQTKIKGVDLTLASNTGNLVKTGYAFKGWNTQADGKGKSYIEGAKYTSDSALTLYALWDSLPKYKVTYNGNDNSGGTVPAAQSKLFGDTLIISDNTGNIEKTGYTFDGWCTSTDSTGKAYAAGSVYTENAPLVLYAKWKPRTFTVTFDGNKNTKGTVPAPQIKVYGEPLVLADNTGNLEKTDYVFDGWCTSSEGVGTDYPKGAHYTGNENIVLFAKWKFRPYTVTYDGNKNTKGEVPAPQLKELDKVLVLATNTGSLERTDHILVGWSTSADGAGTDYLLGANYTDNASVILYAKWKHRPYTVTFDGNKSNSGDAPAAQNKEHDQPLVLPGNAGSLMKTGSVFDGWSTSADGVGTDYSSGSYYTENADVVLYAKWRPQTFAIKYNGNGQESGYVPNSQIKTYGIPITIAGNSGNLKKTGSTFNGWNTLPNGSGTDYVPNETYSTEADLNLYVKWKALETYSVQYDGNGSESGTIPATQTQTKDVPVLIDQNSGNLQRSGYTFGGWATNPDGTGTTYNGGENYTAGVSILLYVKWNPL